MGRELKTRRRQGHGGHDVRRRPAWRENLVQVERGLVGGVRSDSAFFVHFFGGSVVVAVAIVLGISALHWLIVVLCLTLVLTAQMFNQALKSLAHDDQREASPAVQRAVGRGTAAVTVAVAGAGIAIGVIFWQRCLLLYD